MYYLTYFMSINYKSGKRILHNRYCDYSNDEFSRIKHDFCTVCMIRNNKCIVFSSIYKLVIHWPFMWIKICNIIYIYIYDSAKRT